jgi:G-protein alpha subunit
MENLDRLFQANYIPSNQDILAAKSKTTGILETVFERGGLTCRIIDVAEQKSSRRKWLSVFDGIDVLLFVASMSGYDQISAENPVTVSLAICITISLQLL